MSIFKTRTPDYKGGAPNRPDTASSDPMDWLASLFRTPTPKYAAKPLIKSDESKQP